MPGTIMHLTLGQMVYEGIKDLNLNKIEFLSGNILPDEAADKGESHYRAPSSVEGYMLPHMETVKKELFTLTSPYKLGAFCHLYFDYHFFEDYLFPMFIWEHNNDKITSKETGESWSTKEFWSRSVFYSAYGELNHPIINSGLINMADVEEMPELLPYMESSRFDNRREQNWKRELKTFIETEHTYTGKILDFNKTVDLIKKIAEDLIEIINEAK